MKKSFRKYKILIQSKLYENEWYLMNPIDSNENFSLFKSNGEKCKEISLKNINCDLDILKKEYNTEISVTLINIYLNNLGLSSAKRAFMKKKDYNNCLEF